MFAACCVFGTCTKTFQFSTDVVPRLIYNFATKATPSQAKTHTDQQINPAFKLWIWETGKAVP